MTSTINRSMSDRCPYCHGFIPHEEIRHAYSIADRYKMEYLNCPNCYKRIYWKKSVSYSCGGLFLRVVLMLALGLMYLSAIFIGILVILVLWILISMLLGL